jgi:hypothetical protein
MCPYSFTSVDIAPLIHSLFTICYGRCIHLQTKSHRRDLWYYLSKYKGLSIVQRIIDITVKESKSLSSVDLIIGEGIHKAQWQKKDHAIQATLDSSQSSLIVYWKEVNN